ncbi:MAG: lytic transglycosylase domain-containing protein, partial [Alphaproteobacteria bacterium]|nr:lytic transglycosylase domain-containing protein [Alphaproteobacteria bacterium]
MPPQRLLQAIATVSLAIMVLCPRGPALARQAIAPGKPLSGYHKAFASLDAGQCGPAESLVNRGPNPVLNLVLRGMLMAQPGNGYSFDDLAGFISDHPDWPGLSGIIMIAEQKIPSGATADQIVNWFNAHPPLTPSGFYRNIDALDERGQGSKAVELVRDRWINRDFSGDEFTAYQARFGHVLKPQDHRARLDHLLWDNNITAARAMYPFVDSAAKALAEARLALANQLNSAESFLARVPSHYHNDPGLLYERLRWRRKNNMDDSAIEILKQAPGQLGRPDSWWDERNIMIRRVMERRDYRLAYKLAADHGLQSGFDFIQAEFLAGWLALRFLNRPDQAHDHFRALFEAAATPISRARGAYWLGRSLEALGDKRAAEQAYETAAALSTTYYGQLAITRLYADPVIRSDPEPAIPSNVRAA